METTLFAITLASFLISTIGTIVKPFPFQISATNDAKKRGWSTFTILVTRSFSYLTLYTQFWILVAMYNLTATTMFIAQSMSWFVFYLDHGFNLIDPTHLTYQPKEFVMSVINWRPPNNRNIIIWFVLHLQHTVFPFYLHYLTFKYNINYTQSTFSVLCSIVAMIFYTIWYSFCWHVQGIPAYPFMKKMRESQMITIFYSVCFHLVVIIDCILAFMLKELFFYILGILMWVFPIVAIL